MTEDQKEKARERVRRWRLANLDGFKNWANANREHLKEAKRARTAAMTEEQKQQRRDNRREYTREWARTSAFRNRSKRYGLTREELMEMVERQDNRCAICSHEETATRKDTDKVLALALDHDHATDQVRGLLCHKCNRALGLMQDDTILIRAAANYLDRARGQYDFDGHA